MWQDIAALTPPFVMCAGFLVGVVFFLRHQMAPRREAKRAERRRSQDPRS
jgi:membrane protein insertase Oxa1/YidC/SpoIIIJ